MEDLRHLAKSYQQLQILEQMKDAQPDRFKRMRREGTLISYVQDLETRYLRILRDLVQNGQPAGEAREVAQATILDEELKPEWLDQTGPELEDLEGVDHPGARAALIQGAALERYLDRLLAKED